MTVLERVKRLDLPQALLRSLVILVVVSAGFSAPEIASGSDTVPDFLKEKTYDEPLEFTGVSVEDRTETRARLVWETNHPAAGRIKYGSTRSMENRLNKITKRKRHQVYLEGLAEGTKYGFRIYAWDTSDNRIKSQVIFFETKGMPAPDFKSIRVTERTLDGGTLRWVTNIPTRSVFRAGYDTPLEFKSKHDDYTRFHEVVLNQFHPERTIHYTIELADTRNRRTRTGLRQFTTREFNVAWNKPVRGTFGETIPGLPEDQVGPEDFGQRLTDDDFDYNSGVATSGDPADTEQWFVVDLGQPYYPDTAVLYWRNLAYPREYTILGSVFGENWKVLADSLNAEKGTTIRKAGHRMYRHRVPLDEHDASFRYIKVLVPEGASYYGKYPSYNYVQLHEFKLYPENFPGSKRSQDGDTSTISKLNHFRESPGVARSMARFEPRNSKEGQ